MLLTKKQENYLAILFNDLEFSLAQRNAWLEVEFHKKIDQLSVSEASRAIMMLLELKLES